MNNHILATDEFCFAHKRYKRKFEWRHFKRKDWIVQQHLCEKYDLILLNHKTKREKFNDTFDGIINRIKRGKNSKKKKTKWFSSSSPKVNIFPSQKEVDDVFPKGRNKVNIFPKGKNKIFSDKKVSIF